ncbi:MAG: zf-HC2 domain-containing protein [Candidatus Acidiferrales bacterium]
MRCEDISKELIAYLDRRANSAERRAVEDHLGACAACRARAEDFRKLWGVLDEMPVIEPSLGFDARLRARAAAEPRPRWFGWLVPQPRLAFSMAFLLALSVWMARLPGTAAPSVTAAQADQAQQEDFNAIKDLGVLENYDVLTKFDALSELPPLPAAQPRQSDPLTND